jgi:hypothetical protein
VAGETLVYHDSGIILTAIIIVWTEYYGLTSMKELACIFSSIGNSRVIHTAGSL